MLGTWAMLTYAKPNYAEPCYARKLCMLIMPGLCKCQLCDAKLSQAMLGHAKPCQVLFLWGKDLLLLLLCRCYCSNITKRSLSIGRVKTESISATDVEVQM